MRGKGPRAARLVSKLEQTGVSIALGFKNRPGKSVWLKPTHICVKSASASLFFDNDNTHLGTLPEKTLCTEGNFCIALGGGGITSLTNVK